MTVTLRPLASLRLSVNAADAPSASKASVSLTDSAGSGSLSMITPDAVLPTNTAPTGLLNTSSRVSLSSLRPSSTVGTNTVADVSPATILSSRVADSKSPP